MIVAWWFICKYFQFVEIKKKGGISLVIHKIADLIISFPAGKSL